MRVYSPWLCVLAVCSVAVGCAEPDGLSAPGPLASGGDGGTGAGGSSAGAAAGGSGASMNSGGFGGAGAEPAGGSAGTFPGGSGGLGSGGLGGLGTGGVGGAAGGSGGLGGIGTGGVGGSGAGGSGAGGSGAGGSGAGGSGGSPPTADACPGEVLVLQASGASYVGQVTGAIESFSGGISGSCPSAGQDAVYAVTAPASGSATVSVTSSFNASLYARTSCTSGELLCRNQVGANASESFTANVTQGSTYYVFVDSAAAGASGTFTLDVRIDPPAEGEACPGQALTLAGSGAADRTASVSGSTAAASADVSGSCGSTGGSSRDLVYSVTPDISGRMIISLDPASGYDGVLYVRVGNCSGSELECEDGSGGGSVESIETWADAGSTYYMFVDGYSGSSGSFVLDARIEPELDRESCPGEVAVLSGSGPYTWSTTGDTRERVHNYSAACAGANARDAVFAFTPPVSGLLQLNLAPGSGFDAGLYVATSCGGSPLVCQDAGANAGAENISLDVTAGTTYYVVVDGDTSSDAGTYTLNATLSEPPPYDICPGEELVFSGNTATATGSTNLPAHATYTGTCGSTSNSRDAVFHFVAPQSGSAQVRVVPSSGFDTVLYVRTGSCNPGTQVGCRDNGSAGATETLNVTTTAGTDYWVFVDGYLGQSGTFTLSVQY